MPTPKKLLKAVVRPIVRRQALSRLGSLRRLDSPAAEPIAAAIEEAITVQLSAEERRWVDQIESLRHELARNHTPMSLTDFGAGDGAAVSSPEGHSAGIEKSTTIAETCQASKTYFWSLLLFKLVRRLQPKVAIELGTCLGISAAYQAAAQRLNGHGSLVTLEGDPARASLSREHLKSLGLENATVVTGRFSDTLEDTLRSRAPIDYAFIDGHHDEQATITYYEQFLPHLAEEAVVIFDDIAWSDGMRRAWHKLEDDRHVGLAINMRTLGLCVVSKGDAAEKRRMKMLMPV